MIDKERTINQPVKVRVSIFERIVPFAAFGLAAVAGGIGGWMIISLMNTLSAVENAGTAAISGGLAEYTIYPLVLLYAAAALGVVGICVAVGRMIFGEKTASPSGISYIVLGALSLVPIGIVWYTGSIIIDVINDTYEGDAMLLGSVVAEMSIAAMVTAPIVLIVLLAWSLLPFKARPGRRFGPLIALVLMQIILFAVAVMFQLRVSELWHINRTMG